MKTIALVLLIAGSISGLAQEVPDVGDVYAAPSPRLGLGPETDPQRILERGRAALGAAEAVRYDAYLSATGSVASNVPEIWGSVLLGRADGRFRMTLNGSTADASELVVTVGSDGTSFFAIDMLERTFVETTNRAALGELAEVVAHLSFDELYDAGSIEMLSFDGAAEAGGEPCYGIHFADRRRAEHLYVLFSTHDSLPRRIERVRADASGRPGIVRVEIANLAVDPVLPPEPFRPDAPTGFTEIQGRQ